MNIKELRELTGQTQKEFAARFHIPLGTLRRWEYGESTPAPYVLEMIAEKLPQRKESMQVIQSAHGIYYYDKITKTIMDRKGTAINVHSDMEDVNEQNLALYAETMFDSYYEAVEKFDRDCKMDQQEHILWG